MSSAAGMRDEQPKQGEGHMLEPSTQKAGHMPMHGTPGQDAQKSATGEAPGSADQPDRRRPDTAA